MLAAESALVLTAGLVAGVLSATVGVASLVSFPALIAVGLPPVTANASNTVGLTPGALSGVFGYRRELDSCRRIAAVVAAACALGAVGGAALLLALPSAAFETAAPWLVLLATLLVAVQPRLAALVRRRLGAIEPRTRLSGPALLGTFLTGTYGGYFGAGAGVMMVAVLGVGLDLDFRLVNALKTLALLASNLVAGVVFVAVAPLEWDAVALLAAGSVVGGYAGSHLGRRLPESLFRWLIVVAGVSAAVLLMR